MPWDRERYIAEVLDPARRAGNVPPADLYVRYGLPRELTDQDAFDQQVERVVSLWGELEGRQTYASLAGKLLEQHGGFERAGRLTARSFAEYQADARKRQLEQLASLARSEAGAWTHVGPAAVARLRDALGGAVSDDDVRQALGRAGVKIVDKYPAVPVKPHPKQADLTAQLAQLGLRLSAEVVFGIPLGPGFRVLSGFRLADGRTLTAAEIAAAHRRVAVLPYSDPAKAPSENVLAILSAAARTPGAVDELLLSEVVGRLRHFARFDLGQRAIADQGRELGLDADEAGRLAAAVLLTGTREALSQQVADELAGGRLRSAQRLAVGLPADDPLFASIAALHAEVAALTQRADSEEAKGHKEQAAALLAEAIRLAADDDGLSRRLAAIPPPAPGHVRAGQHQNRMRVSWQPSAAAGSVHYLVARGRGQAPRSPSEGSAVVTRTERTEVTDDEAPAGAKLFYSVFAAREGGGEGKTWSPPAAYGPAILTPDIADVSVDYADTSVAMSWRPYPGTDAVHVVRQEERDPRGPDDGTTIAASLTGLADTGLRSGTRYCYLVVASYLADDGQRKSAAGVVSRAVPEPVPRPVTDLDITGPGDGEPAFLAMWTRPPYGQVRLVRGDTPPHWRDGTRISQEEAAALTEIPMAALPGSDGRDAAELRLPPGLHHVTPLTVGHNVVTVGRTADAWLVEPVAGLRADRRQDEVEVSWLWPQGATDALVRWPGGEQRRSHRAYKDEGATIFLTVGPAETTVEVRAVYSQRGRQVVSSCARFPVPDRGVFVSYQVHGASRWRPREVTFELTAEQAVRLPLLVVVRGTEQDSPDDAYDGEVIDRRSPEDIEPGHPVSFTVTAPGGPRSVACFVDPAASPDEASAIVLFPPPAPVTRTVKPQRRTGAYCPYCHEEISRQPDWFRCAGEPGPTGQRCQQAADDALRQRTGFTGVVFPAFAAPRRNAAAECPECGGKTSTAICPVCHSRFPVHFGEVASHLIVPVGAKEAGKTVFMTVLAHELMHRTGDQLNAALTGADDHTRHSFFSEYERPLYRESRLPAPTSTAAGQHNRPPLVFHFTNERSVPRVLAGLPGQDGLFGNRYPRRTLLSFLDTAGEDLRTRQSMEENVRCLGTADGILLLLDPLQMPGARGLAPPGTRLPALADYDEPSTVLQNFTDILLAGNRGKRRQRIDRPLAIVFTKMDALLPSLRESSPLLRPQPRGRYFDEADSRAVHTEIQWLLARWQGSEIDRIARLNYRTYRYFGVSSLGETPGDDNGVSARGIRPYRVTSPMLWLLALFGIIPVK